MLRCAVALFLVAQAYCATTPAPETDEFSKVLDKFKNNMFTAKCEATEWNAWMDTCIWYKGNWGARMENRVEDMKKAGCKVPPATGMKSLMKRFGNFSWWSDSPIVKKIPDTPCGFCGRKVKCCTKNVDNFLQQSYFSQPCNIDSNTPCTMDQLTKDDFTYMANKYPTEWTHTFTADNACNYNLFMNWAAAKFESTKAYNIVKPLLCQMFGTLKPQIQCASNGANQCFCCCTGYTPINGVCQPTFTTEAPTTAGPITTTFVDETCHKL
jgi:hypothetical protein